MDPGLADLTVADVVISLAGRDAGKLFYVVKADSVWLWLANGKDRIIDNPKRKKRKHTRKVLRSDTQVAEKLRSGDKVLNSELRKDLAEIDQDLQGHNLGG